MTNATRYLCAAAYLDADYANTVIRELVASHRAVAPSVGIDLGPIIRHSLRARRMRLGRDILLAVLAIASLLLDPTKTVSVLLIAFFVSFLPSVNWSKRSLNVKILLVAGSLFLAGGLVIGVVIAGLAAVIGRLGGGAGSSGLSYPGAAPQPAPSAAGLISTLLLILIVIIQVAYTYLRSRTLCDELDPDTSPRPLRGHGTPLDTRIARVEGAQHGNLILYSGENPFIGTGKRTRAWSIAIELQRENGGRQPLPGLSRSQGYVRIDPVELHQVIRYRLMQMGNDELPLNERLGALTIHDHIVGLGQHRWDSPLVDLTWNVPYSQASPEAVAALIRHPQAGLRYYQRVSVCDEGQAVWAGQQKVVEGSDQDIAASAFVYVAVEGRMLYLEFVAAVVPPVSPRWHLVDRLPRLSAPKFWINVVLDSFSSIFRDLACSPFRGIGTLLSIAKAGRSYQEEKTAANDFLYGEIGAQVSVREMGAAANYETYMQKLDAEKYTKLIERLINDTVLDFLAAKGVDTSAYANSATAIMNSGTIIAGNTFSGPAAFGAGAVAHAAPQPQQARA